MYKDIKPGKYEAVAIGGQFTQSSEKKTPCVAVLFEFECEGNTEQLWWTGWLSPAAIERTIETLANIGYDEEKGHLSDGSIPAAHFSGNKVQIVIDEEHYTAKDGSPKTSMKIKYVNKLGGSSPFGGSQDPNQIKSMLASVNLKAQMKAARAKLGLKNAPDKGPQPPKFDTTEEIPF